MAKQRIETTEDASATADEAINALSAEQKRALALKLLGGDADEELHRAEQEKESSLRIEQAMRDEETRQRNEPHFWIEINRRGPDDNETNVFVGAGGVSYWIQKDVAVPVPKSVLDVLDCAVITGHVPIVDEALGVKWVKKMKYKRYPYSRLGPASREEVAKFRAEQDEARRLAEDATIGQEMARATLVRESVVSQEEPFIPAYLKEQKESPI